MARRRHAPNARQYFLLSALLLLPCTLAQGFDCLVSLDDLRTYDVNRAKGEQTLSRTRETPPSTMLDELRFDRCADLTQKEGVAEGDQVRRHCATHDRMLLT